MKTTPVDSTKISHLTRMEQFFDMTSTLSSALDTTEDGINLSRSLDRSIDLQESSRLFALPAELRIHIWHFVFTNPSPSFFVRSVLLGDRDAKVNNLQKDVLYTCKLAYLEIFPVMRSHINLLLNFANPDMLTTLLLDPPAIIAQHITTMIVTCRSGSMTPPSMLDLRLLPKLKTMIFSIYVEVPLTTIQTNEEEYIRTSAANDATKASVPTIEQAFTRWVHDSLLNGWLRRYVCRLGGGGWISKLIDPNTFGQSPVTGYEIFIEAAILLGGNKSSWWPNLPTTVAVLKYKAMSGQVIPVHCHYLQRFDL